MASDTLPTPTRSQIESLLVARCWKNEAFKREILKDPKEVIGRHFGGVLPPDVHIQVHQEDAATLHLTIPVRPPHASELSDEELERVAGGTETVLITVFISAAGVGMATGMAATAGKANGW